MVVGKVEGKVYEIVRVADTVGFSKERGWVMLCGEPGKMNSLAIKWVPISTQFEWVKVFSF